MRDAFPVGGAGREHTLLVNGMEWNGKWNGMEWNGTYSIDR